MKKQNWLKRSVNCVVHTVGREVRKRNRISATALLLLFAIAPTLETRAQDIRYSPLRVSSVTAQDSINGTTVSIVAEGSLRRAQTWQDSDGYHVVVPYATAHNSVKPVKGVKVRRLGQALEILVQAPPGTGVSAQVDNNRLNVFVDGDLDPQSEAAIDTATTVPGEGSKTAEATQGGAATGDPAFTSQFPNQSSASSTSIKAGPPALQPRPDLRVNQTQGPEPAAPESEIALQPEEGSFFSSIFSTTSVLIVLGLGIIGLIVSRKLRKRPPRKAKAVSQPVEEALDEPENSAQSALQVPQRRAPDKHEVASSDRRGGQSASEWFPYGCCDSRLAVWRLPH